MNAQRAETSRSDATRRRRSPLIVGIGASAGGLAAFKSFFANMPADTSMTFVLVQHLAPLHKSMLVDLLQAGSAMPVAEAQDGMPLTENHIFVIPPNATMTFADGLLRVASPAPAREHRRPIDTFFASLAENYDECAVGIVLSGVGSDGTSGIRTIKERGGLTLAQAEFDHTAMSGMPRSAAATGLVDFVLPVEAMPGKLIEHQRHLNGVAEQKAPDGTRHDGTEHLTAITSLLRGRTSHDFSGYKEKTLIRRIQRRMQVLQIETFPAYVEHLRVEQAEGDALFGEFLIGVTQFFRDPEAFEALKLTVLPPLIAARAADEPIRVWVPGCATGEEVYSIAILMKEALSASKSSTPVAIFGTDIDARAVAVARAGRYRKLDGLSPERLDRWFVTDGDDHCPIPAIREMCVFSTHSVVKDPPFSKLDLISCRNVFIYLGDDFQRRAMQTFHYALRPGGHLFLGTSESVTRERNLFAVIDRKQRILRRRDSDRVRLPDFRPAPAAAPEPAWPAPRTEEGIDKSARRAMEKYSPAYVVIDANHDILRFSGGETGPYLEPSAGAATLNLFGILRKALRTQVRAAVEKARITRQTVMDDTLTVRIDGKRRAVTLIVEPLMQSGTDARLWAVAFRERDHPPAAETPQVGGGDVDTLQQELSAMRSQLRAASDELETHIEEMKSATEEYQSVNEELQSSNEELETSKEEMQSINEELQTVNSELNGKNDQLTQANSDLQNLMDSTQIATIFLDDDLRIRSFTPAITDLFPLRDADRGRSIIEIVTHLTYDELRRDVTTVQRTLAVVEHEVELKNASATYVMRIRPYRSGRNVIDGVVITFVDITERKKQADHLDLLMREMSHRTNNMLAVIQAMARQTARHAGDLSNFVPEFAARLQGLAHSNQMLVKQDWKGVALDDLVRTHLQPFVETDNGRVVAHGPALLVKADIVQSMGLVLHELATNASKYGALSTPGGSIAIEWKIDAGKSGLCFRMTWREHGGPPVKKPQRKGFGRIAIEQMVARALDAKVTVDFAAEGVIWSFDIPAGNVVSGA